MGFYIIKGTFHVVGYAPDGDSIRFKADNPANWNLLDGRNVELNARGHAQLRLESIDSLETHAEGSHQPLDLAFAALDFLLAGLGITNVQMTPNRSRVISANDGVRGYIISRAVEKNNRPISFVFAGDTKEADWSPVFLDVERLRQSLNFQSIAAGMSYPTYYQGFFPDLRDAMTAAAAVARAAYLGVWEFDRTNSGFDVPNLAKLENEHIIMPKLFRRLAKFLNGGGTATGFKTYLESLQEGVTIISSTHFTHFDTVVEVEGDVVRMTEPPENLIFKDG